MEIGDKVIHGHNGFGVVVALFASGEDTMVVVSTDGTNNPSKLRIADTDSLIRASYGFVNRIAMDNIREEVLSMKLMGLDTQQIKAVLREVMESVG